MKETNVELSQQNKEIVDNLLSSDKITVQKKQILRNYFTLYIHRAEKQEIKYKTARQSMNIIRRFSISMGFKDFCQLDIEDFSNFYKLVNGNNISSPTRESYQTKLREFFDWYFKEYHQGKYWKKVELDIQKVFRNITLKKNMLLNPVERAKIVKERSIQKYLNSELLVESQKELLREYDNYRKSGVAGKFSIHCRVSNLMTLHQFGAFVKKPFKEVTKIDIQNYFADVSGRSVYGKPISTETINCYKVRIMTFYKFLEKGRVHPRDDYPEIVSNIKIDKIKRRKEKEEMLTREEISKMIQVADTPRDKLLISLYYEGGLRIQEGISIKLIDIKSDDNGFIINFPRIKRQKEGLEVKKVPFRIIESEPYLRAYLNYHPFNKEENPDAPLFVLTKMYGCPMGGEAVRRRVKRFSSLAKIKKRVYPHLLRHSRVTHWREEGLQDHHIIKLIGWAEDTKMLNVYAHTDIDDSNNERLKRAGKLEPKKITENPLTPIQCPRCDETNPVKAQYCYSCGHALERIQAMNDDTNKKLAIDQAMEFMMKISQNPQLLAKYQNFIAKMDSEDK